MSVIVTAALLALSGAALSGVTVQVLGRWRKRRLAAKATLSRASEADPPRSAVAGFRVNLGDVISVRGNELWLEQGWLLRESEESFAQVLFAREATLVALPEPHAALFWLEPVTLAWPAEPPPSIDVAGLRHERARRVPVEVEALGETQDPPWTSALVAEYRALDGEVVWALGRAGAFKSWRGRRLDPSEIEHWG
jgi:hypothetical protein